MTHDLDIREVFDDAEVSRPNSEKRQFDRLIRDIEQGKIDGILCMQLESLSRNVADMARLDVLFGQSKLKEILTVSKGDDSPRNLVCMEWTLRDSPPWAARPYAVRR